MPLKVTIDKTANELVIRAPIEPGAPSSSGKMILVAGTGGFVKTEATLDGKVLKMNLCVGYAVPAAA